MCGGLKTHLVKGLKLPFKRPGAILTLCLDAELASILVIACLTSCMYVTGVFIGPIPLETPLPALNRLLAGVVAGGFLAVSFAFTVVFLHSFMVARFYSKLSGNSRCNLARMFRLQLLLLATLIAPPLAGVVLLALGCEEALLLLAALSALAAWLNTSASFLEVELVVNGGNPLKRLKGLLGGRGARVVFVYILVRLALLAPYLASSYLAALTLKEYGAVGFAVYVVLTSALGGFIESLSLSVKYSLYTGCLNV